MFETMLPILLKALGYERAEFDAGLKKAENFADELKTRLLNCEETIQRLEAKIDSLISVKGE